MKNGNSCPALSGPKSNFGAWNKRTRGFVHEGVGNDGSYVICMTTAPNLDQYRAFVDALDKATAGLSEFVKDATYAPRKRLLDTYVSYPAPFNFKVVAGGFSYKEDVDLGMPGQKVSFTETYVNKEDAVTVSGGSTNFSGGGQLGRRFGPDGGLSRYGYLFEKYLPASSADAGKK